MKYPLDISGYWQDRREHDLYKIQHGLIKSFFYDATSAIDVGSYIGAVLCDLDWIDHRVASDISDLTANWEGVDGVSFVHGNAFELQFPKPFDLVISNQTVEHLSNPKGFVEKLISLGKGLVVSTTYNTPSGLIDGHIQDPIDIEKFTSWFPCDLDCMAICYHPAREIGHIIGIVKQSHPFGLLHNS